jgi:N-acetylglucosaminyldiphosphoundecaprenol N-acetyl-beta-D-mannosaminyltransferase
MELLLGGESRTYFVCANPHSLHVADSDPAFSTAVREADIVVADGVGIVIASRILGGSVKERVTGSDVFRGVTKAMDQEGGYRCFFLGASEATLARLVMRFRGEFPNVEVAGSYSPPYKPEFTAQEEDDMVRAINEARPDILWVAMTAPKQEKWIHRNIGRLDVQLAGPIGAVFDFYIGNVKRSHPVFQRLGLEWLPRLIQEPRRLWRRNFVSNPAFMWKVVRSRFKRPDSRVAEQES